LHSDPELVMLGSEVEKALLPTKQQTRIPRHCHHIPIKKEERKPETLISQNLRLKLSAISTITLFKQHAKILSTYTQ
jgi:hypothetical protein